MAIQAPQWFSTANVFCRCWVLYKITKSPEVLRQLRAEHDEVLGSEVKLAAEVLSAEPHKLNSLRYTTAVIQGVSLPSPVSVNAPSWKSRLQLRMRRDYLSS
ncbi:hypothetical protein F5Y06DRAFT_277396 [Hypoxylon sp. FL0890]|nr:hypothetical protein F5Y06DRAFT_277396 [Hypoxylon sp. FL0890]